MSEPVSTMFDNVFVCYQGQNIGHVNLIHSSVGNQLKFALFVFYYNLHLCSNLHMQISAISTLVFDRQIILMHVGPTEMQVVQCNQDAEQADHAAGF